MQRRFFVVGLAAAAIAIMLASTAYACVVNRGTMQVNGSVRNSNLMKGSGVNHGYCAGGAPTTAAAGPAGTSSVSATVAASASGCIGQLSSGTYDVKLRNTTAGYTGTDGVSWTMGANMGCFSGAAGGTIYTLGTMSVNVSGGGSGSWTVPSGAATNGVNDASVFCIKNRVNSDGFLAPFRVSTI